MKKLDRRNGIRDGDEWKREANGFGADTLKLPVRYLTVDVGPYDLKRYIFIGKTPKTLQEIK
jgi:hypothetical protein